MTLTPPSSDGQRAGADLGIAAFLAEQVDALGELDLVVVVPLDDPLHAVEVNRGEDDSLTVRVPTRRPGKPLRGMEREQLDRLGYRVHDPSTSLGERSFDRAPEAAAATLTLLRDVFGHDPARPSDIRHGSRRPERDAARKLAELRKRIEPILTEFVGGTPDHDGDGDYVVHHSGVQVVVAPRAIPTAIPLVRVATVTNLGITPSPDVGLLLANLNFDLAIGRFALDTEHRAIWFDETLLGDDPQPAVLRAAIEVVSHTAADWSARFQQLFGGAAPSRSPDAAPADAAAHNKPGSGAYL